MSSPIVGSNSARETNQSFCLLFQCLLLLAAEEEAPTPLHQSARGSEANDSGICMFKPNVDSEENREARSFKDCHRRRQQREELVVKKRELAERHAAINAAVAAANAAANTDACSHSCSNATADSDADCAADADLNGRSGDADANSYSDAAADADADRAADADLSGRIDDIVDDFEEMEHNMDVDDDDLWGCKLHTLCVSKN